MSESGGVKNKKKINHFVFVFSWYFLSSFTFLVFSTLKCQRVGNKPVYTAIHFKIFFFFWRGPNSHLRNSSQLWELPSQLFQSLTNAHPADTRSLSLSFRFLYPLRPIVTFELHPKSNDNHLFFCLSLSLSLFPFFIIIF